ncbi:hypothetical protein ACFSQD_18530 [Flavihumibacter stibioxidans]|uniref:Uncharacterized protein n=1 Tax=Flavihumibacter stibioxidans TaxID=1834163 RepID=A0ABR7MC25_9BACT|nr:hypothetical protein [Flavihumibacter stibioxidans]MBC6492590.1 hypothetical protein [Flavihumibacter stibioxidans]
MQQLFISLVVLLSLSACTDQSSSADAGHAIDHAANHSDHSTHSVPDSGLSATLQTDHGNKWKADEATIRGIRQMTATVAAGMTGTLQGQPLSDSLSANFAEIFSRCTMKGPAHDQLHLYLQPLKTQLDALKAGAGESRLLEEMQQHLADFDHYFE